MNVLDLFSGIGGFSLGLERAGMRTVAFCEIDPYCRGVLRKHWPNTVIYYDIRKLRAPRNASDVISAGFPCQDISSVSRKRAGLAGEYSGLWAEVFRLVCEIRPKFVILENSPSVLVRGMGEVLSNLADAGYDAEWCGIPAAAIGAPHLRARQWVLAYPTSIGSQLQEKTLLSGWNGFINSNWWASKPDVGRVAHGVPSRVDRLRVLGNAIVPQIAEIIGKAIMAVENGPH